MTERIKKALCKGVATHSLITAIVFTYVFSTYSTFSATVLLWSDPKLNTLLKGITVAANESPLLEFEPTTFGSPTHIF